MTRFWIPLVGLFTGMRLNEICQLTVYDLKQSETGIWFIAVTKGGDDQSLKTHSSERIVPVHSKLQELGFIRFGQSAKRTANYRIFDELRKSSRGYFSEEFSKWFSRTLLPSVNAKTSTTAFHSFRHNFRDALRKAGISTQIAQALGGWSSDEGVSENYGKGNFAFEIDQLKTEIDKIDYATIDFESINSPNIKSDKNFIRNSEKS